MPETFLQSCAKEKRERMELIYKALMAEKSGATLFFINPCSLVEGKWPQAMLQVFQCLTCELGPIAAFPKALRICETGKHAEKIQLDILTSYFFSNKFNVSCY